MNLTPEQKRIMLTLCDAAERAPRPGSAPGVALTHTRKIREIATGMALTRKGYATRLPNGRFEATTEGYWLGDSLRIEDRQGKIPPRTRQG